MSTNVLANLKSDKARRLAEAQTLVNAGVRSTEEKKRYEALLTEIDGIQEHIDLLERADRGIDRTTEATQAPVAAPAIKTNDPEARRAAINKEVRDVLLSGSGSAVVPEQQFAILPTVLKQYAPWLSLATVKENTTGRPTQFFGAIDDTSEFLLAGTEGAAPAEVDPTFDSSTLKSHDLISGTLKASIQLVQDSAFSIEDLVKGTGGRQLARALDYAVMLGTDPASTPLNNQANLLSVASVGQTTSVLANGIGWGDITALIENVDPMYLNSPGSAFVMNYSTYITLLSQKDGNGRRFYDELYSEQKLARFPVVFSAAMPSIGASTTPLALGDLSQLAISYDGLHIVALRERFISNLEIGYVLASRVASKLLTPNSIKLLKIAAS